MPGMDDVLCGCSALRIRRDEPMGIEAWPKSKKPSIQRNLSSNRRGSRGRSVKSCTGGFGGAKRNVLSWRKIYGKKTHIQQVLLSRTGK